MTQYGFYFNSARCTGCRTCEMACKDYNDTSDGVAFRKVYDYEGGGFTVNDDGSCTTDAWAYHLSISCQHCDYPACVEVCPTTAMRKDDGTGLVSVDDTKCIGCGYCAMACPYNAPTVDREVGHTVKCDGCASRVAKGLDPICVDACPLRALDFGDIEELRAAYPDAIDGIAPMPDASITSPNILINPSPAAKYPGDTTGHVANPLEVE